MYKIIKRGVDVFGSLSGLILLSPFFVIVGTMSQLDGGSVFFSHQRIGYKGKTFVCWKFRTMVPNSEELLQSYLKQNPKARKEWNEKFKLTKDPRITKIGKFLRKTSLDELPQLWNVLKGEMSLVGPRPIVKDEIKYYGKNIAKYYSVKPGLTGLWQVSGRSDTSYEERVKLDIQYIDNPSVLKDMIIMIKTIKVVLLGSGAN